MHACRSVSAACRPAETRRRRGEIGGIPRWIRLGRIRPNGRKRVNYFDMESCVVPFPRLGGGRWIRILCQTTTGHTFLCSKLLRGVRQCRRHDERRWNSHVFIPGQMLNVFFYQVRCWMCFIPRSDVECVLFPGQMLSVFYSQVRCWNVECVLYFQIRLWMSSFSWTDLECVLFLRQMLYNGFN